MFWMFLAGCMTETSFWNQTGAVQCARAEECDKSNFDNSFSSQADCRAEAKDTYDDWQSCYSDNCDDFDPQNAADYLHDLRTADCNDRGDADASGIYQGCDEMAVGLCIAGF